jgi:hypothetical protein
MLNLRIASRTIPLLGIFLLPAIGVTQTSSMPPDYRGVQVHIPGVYITPVPYAPFSADVQIVTHQKLTDGTETVRMTINHIARDSSGRIYNESRQLVTTTFKGDPLLTSARIYDPVTRHDIVYNPQLRLARETVLQPEQAARQMPTQAPVPTFGNPSQAGPNAGAQSRITQTDLGDQIMDGTTLHGTQKQHTIDAVSSSTGQPVTVTDEYWYSPDLAVYLIVKHNDSRSGEQIVAVTHIDRHEPPAAKFAIPDGYKVVDETPPAPITK